MSVVYSKSTIHEYFDTDGDKATFSRDDAEKFLNDAGLDNDETDDVLDDMFATKGQTYERVWEFVTDLKEKFLPANSQQENGSEAYHTTLSIKELVLIFDAEADPDGTDCTEDEDEDDPDGTGLKTGERIKRTTPSKTTLPDLLDWLTRRTSSKTTQQDLWDPLTRGT
jgi:hypothetical protein